MMRDPIQLLRYEAKRRPVVAEMWERRATLTDEEIDTAPLPLPWFRKAFRLAREEAQQQSANDHILELAKANPIKDDEVVEGQNSIRGMMVEYLGDTAFFKSATGFESEVKHSTWLFFPKTGGAWDQQTFFNDIPRAFLQNRPIAEMTRHQYVLAWADELQRRY